MPKSWRTTGSVSLPAKEVVAEGKVSLTPSG